MAQIPAYTTNNVEELLANAGGGMALIPDDVYRAVIVKSEIKDTSKGGKSLNLHFVVTTGQYKDTEFVERLNIVNDNTTTVKIAYETLARISKAVGLSSNPADSSVLHNKPILIKTKTEKGTAYTADDGTEKMGKDKSVIDSRGYAAVGGSVLTSDIPFDAKPLPAADKMPWEMNQ